ncbi:hypothetical protein FG386_001187 [Cryptosporidium ryanae]|uniref:uncharacterized protein n=1 Tax=Cryptosporidium ryanae TaxID=515981 RepID=UPI00351A592E|nr:hypothetical protein FG386_001187 [Cryptosporidium ryanae]
MTHRDCRYILFPKLLCQNLAGKGELETIILPHTRTNTLCEYIIDTATNQVYDIYEHKERLNGIVPSAFVDNECISNFNMCVATLVDSAFFIISILAYVKSKSKLNTTLFDAAKYYIYNLRENYDPSEFGSFDVIENKLVEFYKRLIRNPNVIEKISTICDTISNDDNDSCDNKKYTLNEDKLIEYISNRISKAADISIQRNIVFKENINNSESHSSSRNTAKTLACDLFFACIPNVLTYVKEKLRSSFGEIKYKGNIETKTCVDVKSKNSYFSKNNFNPKKIKKSIKKQNTNNGNILSFIKLKKH